MKNRKRNLSIWIGGLVISLFCFTMIIPSIGSGMVLFKRYFPLVAKEYLPTPTPITPTPVGPVGGTFTALVVDPNRSQILLAGSYVSGVYKTYDQGNTWYRQNSGLGNLKIQSLAYHPNNSNIVYAGTYEGGVYRSLNGGTSWNASSGGVMGNHVVYDIEIDPNNPNVIYAATRINVGEGNYNNLRGYLYRSTNAGASWTLLISGDAFSTLDYFYDIDVNPLNSNELYLTAHEHGFYKSTDGGATFNPINNGVSDLSARSFTLDAAYPGLVYGAVWHDAAAYRTWNAGYSWSNSRVGLPTNTAVFRMYADPYGGSQKRVFACTYGNGLYSTDDFAQSWTSRGLAGQRLYDFVVAIGSPQRWFAATEDNGVYRTNAGSSSWSNIMGELRLNAVTAILQDDQNDGTYAAVYGKGVYAIDSSGTNWSEITQDLVDKDVVDIAIYEGRMHVLTESALYDLEGENWLAIDLPVVEAGKETVSLGILSEKTGLPEEMLEVHQEQSQLSMGLQDSGLGTVVPISLLAQNENLYMGTIENGLYMRVAKEWKQVGLEGKSVIDIAFDNGIKYLFVVACESANRCGIFQSKDGEWISLQSNLLEINVNKLVETENGLMAATNSGIYWFDRVNQQWLLIGGQGKEILSIATADNCALAAAGLGFVLVSSDCGENWQQILLENWHYQTIGLLGERRDLLLAGSLEAGAIILPYH